MTDKKYYPEHKALYRANIVETCEGEGTEESPKRVMYYVYHDSGVLLGKIDSLKFNKNPELLKEAK